MLATGEDLILAYSSRIWSITVEKSRWHASLKQQVIQGLPLVKEEIMDILVQFQFYVVQNPRPGWNLHDLDYALSRNCFPGDSKSC